MVKAGNVRKLALETLNALEKGEKLPKQTIEEYVGSILDPHLGEAHDRDRAFLMELVYGTLRYRDRLDWVLKRFLKNPSALGHSSLNNLRLALYQLTFMRVPGWAAVNEAVELEKGHGKPAVVNAVLRNFMRQEGGIELPVIDSSPVEHISVSTSHPRWMVQRWVDRFGVSEALALAASNNVPPPMTLTANTCRTSAMELVEELRSMGIESELTAHSPRGVRLMRHISYGLLEPLRGKTFVQDEASQLVSMALCAERGHKILDACAAPGGKAAHVAILTDDLAYIAALDKSPRRVSMVGECASALKLGSIHAMLGDVRNVKLPADFDRVILDAPCSSTGVIRKNPDVKLRLTKKHLVELAENQLLLLESASGHLKKDGLMVYSVCSTEPEEGEEVVKKFLKKNPGYYIIESAGLIKDKYGVDYRVFISDKMPVDGCYRTYPHNRGLCEYDQSEHSQSGHGQSEDSQCNDDRYKAGQCKDSMDGFFFATLGRSS
ncbi:MAG: 16S rRNA (cytosine(967)-C(5))-methyltransferase RsmB [Nitrospirae bacterium]|nr:16S rRNA (cytosine(967)-C(5))-methyltransferase RsmB [Nitrospirota bacterium]